MIILILKLKFHEIENLLNKKIKKKKKYYKARINLQQKIKFICKIHKQRSKKWIILHYMIQFQSFNLFSPDLIHQLQNKWIQIQIQIQNLIQINQFPYFFIILKNYLQNKLLENKMSITFSEKLIHFFNQVKYVKNKFLMDRKI